MTEVAWLSLIFHAGFILAYLTSFRRNPVRFRMAAAWHLIVTGFFAILFSLAVERDTIIAPSSAFVFFGVALLSLRDERRRLLSVIGVSGAAYIGAALAVGLNGDLSRAWNASVLLKVLDPGFCRSILIMESPAQILGLVCASVSAWSRLDPQEKQTEVTEESAPSADQSGQYFRRSRIWLALTMVVLYGSRETAGLQIDFYTTHSAEGSFFTNSGLLDWSPVTQLIGGPFNSGSDVDGELEGQSDNLLFKSHFAFCSDYELRGCSWTPLVKRYSISYRVEIRQFHYGLSSEEFQYGNLSLSGDAETWVLGFCSQRKLKQVIQKTILRRVNRAIRLSEAQEPERRLIEEQNARNSRKPSDKADQ